MAAGLRLTSNGAHSLTQMLAAGRAPRVGNHLARANWCSPWQAGGFGHHVPVGVPMDSESSLSAPSSAGIRRANDRLRRFWALPVVQETNALPPLAAGRQAGGVTALVTSSRRLGAPPSKARGSWPRSAGCGFTRAPPGVVSLGRHRGRLGPGPERPRRGSSPCQAACAWSGGSQATR
jgi:hypothetical protein